MTDGVRCHPMIDELLVIIGIDVVEADATVYIETGLMLSLHIATITVGKTFRLRRSSSVTKLKSRREKLTYIQQHVTSEAGNQVTGHNNKIYKMK